MPFKTSSGLQDPTAEGHLPGWVHFQASPGTMSGNWTSGIIHSCSQIANRQNWIWSWNRRMSNVCLEVIVDLTWHTHLLVLIFWHAGKHLAEMTICQWSVWQWIHTFRIFFLLTDRTTRFWNTVHAASPEALLTGMPSAWWNKGRSWLTVEYTNKCPMVSA